MRTGVGVTIALLDTAVSTEHPAIRSALLPGADFVGGVAGNGVDDDGDGLIDEGLHHGTYIAGLLHLAAPDAKILPIRVLEEDGRGRAMNLAKGILYAIHAGVDIINVSIGTVEDARVIEDAIDLALANDIVVVAAAGNAGVGLVDFPANHPGVIGVGAVDHLMNKVSFSNYGPEIDLSAPGDSLFSTYGTDQFALWSGTSFATPLVAAGAALIKEKYPNLSRTDVTTLLKSRVQPGGPGFTSDMGTGVVDLEALSHANAYERDTIRVFETETGTLVRWSPVLNATHYDVLRGQVSDLRLIADGGEDATEMGAVVCLGNNLPAEPGAFDSERPQSGEVFFYVFRDNAPDGDSGHYGVNSAGGRRIAGGTDCATP